jgi:hypothetical protein
MANLRKDKKNSGYQPIKHQDLPNKLTIAKTKLMITTVKMTKLKKKWQSFFNKMPSSQTKTKQLNKTSDSQTPNR